MEKEFLNGIKAFKPNDKAPDFVIAELSINVNELIEFMGERESIKAAIKKSKRGTFYIEVNNYQSNKVSQEPKDDLPF